MRGLLSTSIKIFTPIKKKSQWENEIKGKIDIIFQLTFK